ncbi:MAG: hypothetical protein K2J99_14845 [Lachnospiraceae bacterium]|nr:hypothetical protein [Lachnospiraceae bacterium]
MLINRFLLILLKTVCLRLSWLNVPSDFNVSVCNANNFDERINYRQSVLERERFPCLYMIGNLLQSALCICDICHNDFFQQGFSFRVQFRYFDGMGIKDVMMHERAMVFVDLQSDVIDYLIEFSGESEDSILVQLEKSKNSTSS